MIQLKAATDKSADSSAEQPHSLFSGSAEQPQSLFSGSADSSAERPAHSILVLVL